jgi:rhodanese-related sulfurtransferase
MSLGSSLHRLASPKIIALAAASLALAACAEEAEIAPVEELALPELAQIEALEAKQVDELLKEKKIRLIDVRTDEEVAEGMIPGAEHIALDKFDPEKLDLSDGREPVLYCNSDRRSGIAAEKLSKFTGKKARHLKGGFQAWREAKLPVRLY